MNLDWEFTVNSEATRDEMHKWVDALYDEHKYVTFSFRTGRQRTLTQNKALHKWLEWVAEALNDSGLDCQAVMKEKSVSVPWTKENCKELLWRPIQEALTNNESTAAAERTDYGRVQEILTKHIGEKFGVQLPEWPKREEDDDQQT